jgi:hypothetical protein
MTDAQDHQPNDRQAAKKMGMSQYSSIGSIYCRSERLGPWRIVA